MSTDLIIKEYAPALSEYAVRKYDQTAFLKSAMLAIESNPELKKCITTDIGKASFIQSLRYASTTGLSLNPQEGKAAIIPRKTKQGDKYVDVVTYQVMKNGMIDLALESGKVEFIEADYVKKNDHFTGIRKTMDGVNYEFSPALKDRGELIGFFAVMKMKSGATHGKWYTLQEINDHRKQYSEKSYMPEIGYGLKTTVKALLRSVSISAEIDAIVKTDDAWTIEPEQRGVTATETAEKLKTEKKVVDSTVQGDLL
jgi:recombination protein RecT